MGVSQRQTSLTFLVGTSASTLSVANLGGHHADFSLTSRMDPGPCFRPPLDTITPSYFPVQHRQMAALYEV